MNNTYQCPHCGRTMQVEVFAKDRSTMLCSLCEEPFYHIGQDVYKGYYQPPRPVLKEKEIVKCLECGFTKKRSEYPKTDWYYCCPECDTKHF